MYIYMYVYTCIHTYVRVSACVWRRSSRYYVRLCVSNEQASAWKGRFEGGGGGEAMTQGRRTSRGDTISLLILAYPGGDSPSYHNSVPIPAPSSLAPFYVHFGSSVMRAQCWQRESFFGGETTKGLLLTCCLWNASRYESRLSGFASLAPPKSWRIVNSNRVLWWFLGACFMTDSWDTRRL